MSHWLRWQIESRLRSSPVMIPFIGPTRLAVSRGMHGATGNVYCGLHEFNDMAFVLHLLRPTDRFVDIGANVGSYTVLASGVCGASTIAVEPVTETMNSLKQNIKINGLESRVRLEQSALGAARGEVKISTSLDCANHVQSAGESGSFTVVPVTTLDYLVADEPADLLKIDVEGYEMEVLKGAQRVLAEPRLNGVIIELNGSGRRYGVRDDELHTELERFGFKACSYHPYERTLVPRELSPRLGGNQIFVRNFQQASQRLIDAHGFQVFGEQI